MSNTSQNSRILLACIGDEDQPQIFRELHISDVHDVFSPLGSVCKIMLFSKRLLLKAFVEYATAEEAAAALAFLHDCQLNSVGKVQVYFSALQALESSERCLEYKEYPVERRASVSEHLAVTNLSKTEAKALADTVLKSDFAESRQRMNQPGRRVLGDRQNFLNSRISVPTSAFKRASEPVMVIGGSDEFQPNHNFNTQPLPNEFNLFQAPRIQTPATAAQPASAFLHQSQNQSTAQGHQIKDMPPSPVLLISNLDECFFTATELYNVFSCFGNISKLILMKNVKKAMIEYLSTEAAAAAKKGMNLRLFGQTKIKLNFSKYRKINLKKNNKSDNSQHYNEVLIVSPEMQRYSDSTAHEANGPSDTLLYVIPEKKGLSSMELFMHLQTLAKVTGTRALAVEKENEDRRVAKVLFKFRSQTEAIKALALSHNTMLNGVVLSGVFSQVSL